MPMIEIWDEPPVKLAALLDALAMADDLLWTVMELWAVGRDEDMDIVGLERAAEASPSGLTMSAADLRALAGGLVQVVDGIIVGYVGRVPYRSDPDLRVSAHVVFEAIDSSLWRVYARESAAIDDLRQAFTDVREVPEVTIPPVHERS